MEICKCGGRMVTIETKQTTRIQCNACQRFRNIHKTPKPAVPSVPKPEKKKEKRLKAIKKKHAFAWGWRVVKKQGLFISNPPNKRVLCSTIKGIVEDKLKKALPLNITIVELHETYKNMFELAPRRKTTDFTKFQAFYKSKEWQVLRYQALKLYGPVCMVCGASRETGAVIHVDHIKPRYTYPELELEISNLQILCHACNYGKGGWDKTDWRK